MRYGSVCSGIEAATMAWHTLGWTPAFFAEIERFPSAVLAHHYGSNMPGEPLASNGIPNYGDFTQIGPDAGPVDLLVGGTPCQSFSVAGKRLGLDDPRGNLALEYLALARRLRARWIVWENVPGVLSSFSGEAPNEGDPRSGDEWDETGDFATFLEYVRECGYGFAYRVLDAQHVRVHGFGRAVPQRRRRVFVVGYLGDWRRAAAVLLEPNGMRGDPPPRRKQGQGVAPTIASRPTGGGGLGTDFDLDGGLTTVSACAVADSLTVGANQTTGLSGDDIAAFGGGNCSGPIEVAARLAAHGNRQDFEVETFVANPLRAQAQHSHRIDSDNDVVAHSMRAEGFDASEDGTGRATPLVPVKTGFQGDTLVTPAMARPSLSAQGGNNGGGAGAVLVQPVFSVTQDSTPVSGENFSPSLKIGTGLDMGQPPCIAYSIMPQNSGKDYKARPVEVSQPIMAGGPVGGNQGGDVVLQPSFIGQVMLGNQGSGGNRAGTGPEDPHETLLREGGPNAVAFDMRGRDGGAMPEGPHDTASIRAADGDSSGSYVAEQWAVRRLTPTECERLQGFPDGFTQIPNWDGWRDVGADEDIEELQAAGLTIREGKNGYRVNDPDGVRYKALGNSMAVNVMRWIGWRIDHFEKLVAEGRIPAADEQEAAA